MRIATTAFALFLIVFLGAEPVHAQDGGEAASGAMSRSPAPVPFGVGERMSYRVKFGPLRVGEAEMGLVGIDTIAGHPTYHLSFYMKGGLLTYRLEDREESWLDVYRLASRRFRQDLQEGDYERHRVYEFDLENGRYYRDDGESDSIPPNALDDASFVYFVRTVPLEVGETYSWHRYFKFDRNPVTLQVLRRERVEVPAGEFETIVVRPIVKAGGLYGEGGEAEIFLTDDERRIPVLLKSRLKVGTLTLDLVEYERGEPLVEELTRSP